MCCLVVLVSSNDVLSCCAEVFKRCIVLLCWGLQTMYCLVLLGPLISVLSCKSMCCLVVFGPLSDALSCSSRAFIEAMCCLVLPGPSLKRCLVLLWPSLKRCVVLLGPSLK